MPGCPNWSPAMPNTRSAPAELAQWLERFVARGRGRHDRRLLRHRSRAHRRARRDAAAPRRDGSAPRPAPRARTPVWAPAVASLYGQVALRQENAWLSIGERCNANGSRKFRQLQEQGDWDGCVEMGREQVKEGSHTLDLCTAFVGRDEVADMTAGGRAACAARSTRRWSSIRPNTRCSKRRCKLYGGKPIINSINFEDGEEAADKRLELARRFGAAVIALTIDETGMAKEVEHKLAVARRLYDFACGKHGLPPSRPAVRSADLHDLHRQRGRPQARPQHAGGDRADRAGDARVPDHPRPLEHLVRPQPAGAADPELGLSRPRAAPRADRRDRAFLADHAAAPDPAGGVRGSPRI